MILGMQQLRQILTVFSSAPLVLACLGLIASFSYIHHQQLREAKENTEAFAEVFFSHQDYNLASENFAIDAKRLLNQSYYLAIALLNEKNIPIAAYGTPIKHKDLDKLLANKKMPNSKSYLFIPLKSSGNTILIVIDNNPFKLFNHLWYLIALLLLTASLVITYAYYYHLKHELFQPLKKLLQELRNTIERRSHSPLKTTEFGIYHPVAEGINQLLEYQQDLQKQTYSNIESATKDLRESLETVEVRNAELDIARKKALELTKLKSEFLANTSHEIRTPLNGIIGFSELLKKTALSGDQKDYLSTIEDSAKALLTIINDILDFSRLDSGKLSLDYKPFEIIEVVEETLLLQAPAANEKNIKLYCIPDNTIPHRLLGDPLRLQQVITNLVSNAIKFSESGQVAIYIHRLDRNDNKVELKFVVQDDGIGLDIADSKQLFASFSQLQSGDDRSYSGAGLGLTIAKGLVQRMHGEIGVESEKGIGSSFWFTAVLGQSSHKTQLSAHTGTLTNVNALLYDSESLGEFEISSKMNLWGAQSHRVDDFSHIIPTAEDLVTQAKQQTRFYPVAIINAQTSENTVDKALLKSTIYTLSKTLSIPTIVIAPPGKQSLVAQILENSAAILIQRPIKSSKLYKAIFDQLGIVHHRPEKIEKPIQQHTTPIRVLVVDDNAANVKLAKALLNDLNTQVFTADRGTKAIQMFEQKTFDLILMDIQMPDMDGYQTTQAIRHLEQGKTRTPIVALTAHAVADEKAKLLLSGMDDFLSKPIGSSEIHHIIERWVINSGDSHNKSGYSSQVDAIKAIPATEKHVTIKTPVSIEQSIRLAKGNANLAKDMLQMLLDSLPQEKQLIENHFKHAEFSQLQEVIHRIHGGSCYCGVPKLLNMSALTDKNLKDHQHENLAEEIEQMLNEIDELLNWQNEHDLAALFESYEPH